MVKDNNEFENNGKEQEGQDKQRLDETYQLLFDILDEEPAVHVPYTFSSKITTEIRKRRNRVNDIKFYFLISVIGVFGLGIAWLSLSMIDKNSAAVLLDMIVAYKWVWLIALSAIFVVQYIDQRIIVGFFSKR